MAIFKRSVLKEKGLTDEQIDYLMTESNRALAADYMPKSDLQAKIDAAVDAAKADTTITDEMIQGSEAYKALLAENVKIKAFQAEDFANVKAPYRDFVWGKLDHSEKHPAYSEQLAQLEEQMPDIFNAAAPQPDPGKPQFGAPAEGRMPEGKKTPSFGDAWGFVPKSAK